MSRYLVTGGAGVIGSLLTHRLVAAGHEVTVVDSAEEPRNKWIREHLPPSVKFWKGRIEHGGDFLLNLLPDIDSVIHCAASTGIPYSVKAPDDDWIRNVEATRTLLNALREHPRPTVVFSSIKPYWVPPRGQMRHGLTEDALLDPDEPYAASKAAQSMLAQAYARSYDLPVVTFRCSNLFGAAPCHGPRHGWLTWFCIAAAIGRPIEVQGTGQQARDMLFSDDIFTACMAALDKAGELKGEIFNLGGGRDNIISVGDAAEWLRERTGVEVKAAAPRAMDDDLVFVSTGKFRSATGWVPQVGVKEGMEKVLRFALENKAALAKLYEGL